MEGSGAAARSAVAAGDARTATAGAGGRLDRDKRTAELVQYFRRRDHKRDVFDPFRRADVTAARAGMSWGDLDGAAEQSGGCKRRGLFLDEGVSRKDGFWFGRWGRRNLRLRKTQRRAARLETVLFFRRWTGAGLWARGAGWWAATGNRKAERKFLGRVNLLSIETGKLPKGREIARLRQIGRGIDWICWAGGGTGGGPGGVGLRGQSTWLTQTQTAKTDREREGRNDFLRGDRIPGVFILEIHL